MSNVVFNFIAVTVPSTGQTPKQVLKQENNIDSEEFKVGGEGKETSVCMGTQGNISVSAESMKVICLICNE